MKATPGPWTYYARLTASENHKGFIVRGMNERGGWVIADVNPLDEDGDEGRANARLITASPDLLEALRGFVEHGTCFDEADMTRARAAIAKAEGK